MGGRSFVSWYPWPKAGEWERASPKSSFGGASQCIRGKEERAEIEIDRQMYTHRETRYERADGRRGRRGGTR